MTSDESLMKITENKELRILIHDIFAILRLNEVVLKFYLDFERQPDTIDRNEPAAPDTSSMDQNARKNPCKIRSTLVLETYANM